MKTPNALAGIYTITSAPNNKVYVGYSTNIRKRWSDHRCNLRRSLHTNSHLQSAWNLYGEEVFGFAVVEVLPPTLSKEEYEKVETKWVLQYNSHLTEFGYNKCLPGSIPLRRLGENITSDKRMMTSYICININNGEITETNRSKEVIELTSLKQNKVNDLASYWKGKGKRKSLNGWIIVRKEDYNSEFDYIGYKKIRTDYSMPSYIRKPKREWKKNIEDIIPYEKRNLKRISIIAVNIETGEEVYYPTIKSCSENFLLTKVRKCIDNEFSKYKHRGYYFKKSSIGG